MIKVFRLLMSAALCSALIVSCSKGAADMSKEMMPGAPTGDVSDSMSTDRGESYSDSGVMSPEGNGHGKEEAGVVTAGEWNDLANWKFWGGLTQKDFSDYVKNWGFYTDGRIAVKVTARSGEPACGVSVSILDDEDKTLWQTRTDNFGTAECWASLFESRTYAPSELRIAIDGNVQEAAPKITWFQDEEVALNEYIIPAWSGMDMAVDIAFIVDATGSMMDEIDFLKKDLTDIIEKVMQSQSGMKIRTGSVFYRDEGDTYLTRSSNFNEELGVTRKFIEEQEAAGGGDFPEAVHSALEVSLQELSWNRNAHARIAFMLLDAPAHENPAVIESLHRSISTYAKNGIKLIPISASGIDKDTEAMLRLFSISTNSTYVFITNHSGVGGDHIEATVGDYQVEKLNELMIRLINYYTKVVVLE